MTEDSAHDRALVDAYLLLDRAQRTACSVDIAAARAEARRRQWIDVEFFLHYARYAHAELTGADMALPLARMEELAARAGDDALTAVVWAGQAQRAAAGTGGLEPVGPTGLAAAVALLADGAGSRLHRPVAWIECALAYRSLGLWELEEELLVSAAAALAEPWPPGTEPLRTTAGRWVEINRIEARASRVCEALEAGEQALAAELAGHGCPAGCGFREGPCPAGFGFREGPGDARFELSERPGSGGPAGSPAGPTVDGAWWDEVAAVRSVLDAAAGAPERGLAAPGRPDWAWIGYPSCLDLARAIRAAAGTAGTGPDPALAAHHAEVALAGMGQDYLPALRLLALALAGGRPPVPGGARRYARELVELRVAARHRLLDDARAQMAYQRRRREHQAPVRRDDIDHGGRRRARAL